MQAAVARVLKIARTAAGPLIARFKRGAKVERTRDNTPSYAPIYSLNLSTAEKHCSRPSCTAHGPFMPPHTPCAYSSFMPPHAPRAVREHHAPHAVREHHAPRVVRKHDYGSSPLCTVHHVFMTNATPAHLLSQPSEGGTRYRTPASEWLPERATYVRHGTIATPRIKLEFFQHGGNQNITFVAKTIPDTGSSRSIYGRNFVDKYNLIVDESEAAKAHRLYNASGERMQIRGIVDLQAQYSGRMIYIDGLVTEQDMAAPLISWHDLTQLGICSLPENTMNIKPFKTFQPIRTPLHL